LTGVTLKNILPKENSQDLIVGEFGMKTLAWIFGILQVILVGAAGKLLYDNSDKILPYFRTHLTEALLSVFVLTLVILAISVFEINLARKINLRDVFDVVRPVKKLTPADFHITNYREFYIERESDKEIENLLRERNYVFITGIPMLGKTRMAYEASKKLKDFYLLKPKYEKIDIHKLKLPFFKKKVVLFLDDLNKYAGKFDLDDLVRKLKKDSKDFVVIATCRSGKEFGQVFAKKEMETLLTQCQKGKTEPRKLEPEEERRLATAVDKRLERIASDGTPGSITIDLRYMKQRYEELGDEKFILKCLKLLREGYIFLWKENLVKEVSNRIFNLSIERTRWEGYLKSLLRNGFISKFSERISVSHDVYLDDRFLDDYSVEKNDLESLKETLCKLKDAENLFYLGNGFYYKKNLSEGVNCYQKSIGINPDSAEAHFNLGNLLKELKRYDEAEKEYKEALRIKPDSVQAHVNLGLLLYELKRYDEAEKEYKETLRIKPDSVEAHVNLGLLLDDLERYDEAEKEYKEALRIKPDDVVARVNLGSFLKELKRPKEAEDQYREALRIKPDDVVAHNNLGLLLDDLKRYDEAEREYKEALRINPDYALAHYNLGILLKELKRCDEAEKEYKEALRINPDSAEAHVNLGLLLYDLKRYDEAEKEYKEALRINPDSAEAHVNLGLLLYDLKRYDEAEKEYKEALRINPDSAEAHGNLGLLLNEYRRHYDEAEKEYQEALRIKPDYAAAHYNLGNLLLQLDRYDEAEKEYKEAVRINPDYAEAHGNLGILLRDLNRREEAKKQFETARDLFRKQGREEDAKEAEGFLRGL
jgi:tetratricopeptide (TPR) repeat protein